ncbi:MAG: glycosyltransferase [Streptosporangiaceae bacterium]
MIPTLSIVIVCKDEPALAQTLDGVTAQADETCEIIVVDASAEPAGPDRPGVRLLAYTQPPGRTVTIAHQRNAGVQAATGEIVVFVDAGCLPRPGWLARLTAPILAGAETVVAGLTVSPGDRDGLYDAGARAAGPYLSECPTLNLAFRRDLCLRVGGFDESFAYGSDVDFSWRVQDAGERIRSAPDAVVSHDWGGPCRQARRSYVYGRARARLYRKHRARRAGLLRREPMVVVYPLFLLGLPLTLLWPYYPLLLVVPAWRNRRHGVVRTLTDHLLYGAGVLRELAAG